MPGRAHVDQQEADALLLLHRRVGAHQTEDHVGVLSERGPGLLAIHDEVVVLAHRAGLDRREVGAGAGLRVALAPPVLLREDPREVMRLLRRAAERHDHRRDHVQAERDEPRPAGRGALFVEDVGLHRRPVEAAVLPRPVAGEPALLVEDLLPADVVVLSEPPVVQHLRGDIAREIRLHERAHLFAKGLLFGGVVEVHGWRQRKGALMLAPSGEGCEADALQATSRPPAPPGRSPRAAAPSRPAWRRRPALPAATRRGSSSRPARRGWRARSASRTGT